MLCRNGNFPAKTNVDFAICCQSCEPDIDITSQTSTYCLKVVLGLKVPVAQEHIGIQGWQPLAQRKPSKENIGLPYVWDLNSQELWPAWALKREDGS